MPGKRRRRSIMPGKRRGRSIMYCYQCCPSTSSVVNELHAYTARPRVATLDRKEAKKQTPPVGLEPTTTGLKGQRSTN